MLAELAVWLGTPVPWRFRRLGMLGDSVRLWSRGRRRAADWAAHEQNCHAIVHQAARGLQRFDTVVVLGSGLARDVPLAFLANRFKRVVLVDAVHLLPLRLKVAFRRNVFIETRDLTGIVDWIWGTTAGRNQPLRDLADDPSIDLVISANVLSQLALPAENWLEHRPSAASRLPHDIGRQLIDWHLDDIGSFSATICLLTDTSYVEVAKDRTVLAEHDLLHGRRLPAPDATWDWNVAPPGEFADGMAHVHRACGYADFGRGNHHR